MTQKTVIFDCDGVLVDSQVIYNEFERRHLARLGLHYSDDDYQLRFAGLSDKDLIRQLSHDYMTRHGKEFPATFAADVLRDCTSAFEARLKAIEGVTDLLESLTNPCAVASSSKLETLVKKLELTGLKGYFDPHIYSTELVTTGKPSADIFLFTAERLKVAPRQCVVIEDSANGVIAGINAGMEVWGFTGGAHADRGMSARLAHAGAARIFATFPDISAAINRQSGRCSLKTGRKN